MEVELTWDERMLRHEKCRGGHPERPERILAVQQALVGSGLHNRVTILGCGLAARRDLERIHPRDHLDDLQRRLGEDPGQLTRDTFFCHGTWEAALSAAGAGLRGVRESLSEAAPPFRLALCRPPGHHAGPTSVKGFCVLNNASVAAAAALEAGARRVVIWDWDAHHGNGTQEAFYHSPDVLVLSWHRHPYFPFTGAPELRGQGAGQGFNVNFPLEKGEGDETLLYAADELFLPLIREFDPDLILVSAGFDAHRFELLGGLEATAAGFGTLAVKLMDLAQEVCGGRVVGVLEGGYDLDALSRCVCAVVGAVLTEEVPEAPLSLVRPSLGPRVLDAWRGRKWASLPAFAVEGE